MLKITEGFRLTSWLQSVEELNLGPSNTNPFSAKEEDLNSGPSDYKPNALNHYGHWATPPQGKHINHRSFWSCVGEKFDQGDHVIIVTSSVSFQLLKLENLLR